MVKVEAACLVVREGEVQLAAAGMESCYSFRTLYRNLRRVARKVALSPQVRAALGQGPVVPWLSILLSHQNLQNPISRSWRVLLEGSEGDLDICK